MNYFKIAFSLAFVLALSAFSFAQTRPKEKEVLPPPAANAAQAIKSSPAYAEILLRKTELLSDLEALLVEYTEDFPKVKEIRYENELLQKELGKLLAVNSSEAGRLTLALGKLMVRRAEIETDLWSLRRQYNDDHPDIKRAKRKMEIFDAAIKDILPAK